MLERLKSLSDGEKLGLGLLTFLLGGKVLDGLGKIIFFLIWLVVIIGFIGFFLLMAAITGS